MTENHISFVEGTTAGWVVAAAVLASSMAFIDATALNVALPTIQAELAASGTELLWIVNAYNLFLAALILVGGALGDRYGRKRVFAIGIVAFTAASLVCASAPTPGTLVAARAAQGIGAALLVPGSLSIISATIGPDRRGAAIGTWSAFTTITVALGPALGGSLAGLGLWRVIFLLNVPLAGLALYALMAHVPETRDESLSGIPDIPGSVLITLGLAGLTFAFTEGSSRTWADPLIVGTLVGGVMLIAASVWYEARIDNPLMPPTIFTQSRTFTGANLLTFFLYAALYGLTVFLPMNLVQIQGYPQTMAGLAMIPFSVMLAVMSRWSGGLVQKVGPRLPLTAGPLIVAVGLGLFSLVGLTPGPRAYWTTFLLPAAVFGVGMGLTVAPLTTTVMSALPERFSGMASGVNNAVSRTGGVLAIAILGALMITSFQSALTSRVQSLDLPAETTQELVAQATRLGDAQVPATVRDDQSGPARMVIDLAFVDAFRMITRIGTVLAMFSAVLAYATIDPHVMKGEDTD